MSIQLAYHLNFSLIRKNFMKKINKTNTKIVFKLLKLLWNYLRFYLYIFFIIFIIFVFCFLSLLFFFCIFTNKKFYICCFFFLQISTKRCLIIFYCYFYFIFVSFCIQIWTEKQVYFRFVINRPKRRINRSVVVDNFFFLCFLLQIIWILLN